MPNIIPFKGLRYNLGTKDISSVVSPPYDVISTEEKFDLESKSKYNAIHVELPGQNNEDYLRASELFLSWISEGKIIQDKNPCLYLSKHEFSINNKIGFTLSPKISDKKLLIFGPDNEFGGFT